MRMPISRWVRGETFVDAGDVFAKPSDASLRDPPTLALQGTRHRSPGSSHNAFVTLGFVTCDLTTMGPAKAGHYVRGDSRVQPKSRTLRQEDLPDPERPSS